jgi:peptidoglycan hydrolase-like protein with peptidoglycan-binding domain
MVMKSGVGQRPFSASEFAVGSLAMILVVVVTFLGLRPRARDPLPPPPASAPPAKVQSRLPSHRVNPQPTASSGGSSIFDVFRPSSSRSETAESNNANASMARVQTAPAAQPPKEEAANSMSGTERDPQNRPDATWIQAKLGDLGYFSGNRNGVWGGASRSALRDFKSMNGLPENDRWDKDTEQRLSSREVIPASKTFIGGWAEGDDQCGSDADHGPPIVISSRAAKTEGGECNFRSIKREGAGHWRVDAVCTSEGNSWNANIDLKLSPPNLIWTSERGATTYVRCGKP